MSAKHRGVRGGRRRGNRRLARFVTASTAVVITAVAIGGRLLLSGGTEQSLVEVEARMGRTDEIELNRATTPSPAETTRPQESRAAAPPEPARRADGRSASGQHSPRPVPEVGSGRFAVADGSSDIAGHGDLVTYSVEVEQGLAIDADALARIVDNVLDDRRGWTTVVGRSLQRVETNSTVQIRLATPGTTDELCSPLDTGGRLSCRNGKYVVLNAWRWEHGAKAYDGDLANYRRYMINHEFGHALGNGHQSCPSPGEPAPVMVQQTKGLSGCAANPWPSVTSG